LHCFFEIWFGLVFFTQVVTVGHVSQSMGRDSKFGSQN